eukprot:tig00021127_g18770.t1
MAQDFEALKALVDKLKERGDLATAHDCIAQKLGEGRYTDLHRAELACAAAAIRLQLLDNDGALDLYSQALSVYHAVRGPDDLDSLLTAHEIASILAYVKGRPGEALEIFRDIARRCEASFGGENQDVTYAALMDLGTCLRDVNRTAEAILVLRRALDGYRGMLGPESAMAGRVLSAIGDCYRRTGEHEAARRILMEAAAVQRKVMEAAQADAEADAEEGGGEAAEGAGHQAALELAGTLKSLGFACMCLKDGQAATEAYASALEGYRSQLGPENPATLQAQDDYACVVRDFGGEHTRALHLFHEVLAARQRLYGDTPHASVAWSLCFVGDTLFAMRDYAKAREHYKAALAVASRALPPGDYRLAHFKHKCDSCPEVVTGAVKNHFRENAKARIDTRSPPRRPVRTPLSRSRWSQMVPKYAAQHPSSPAGRTLTSASASSLHRTASPSRLSKTR